MDLVAHVRVGARSKSVLVDHDIGFACFVSGTFGSIGRAAQPQLNAIKGHRANYASRGGRDERKRNEAASGRMRNRFRLIVDTSLGCIYLERRQARSNYSTAQPWKFRATDEEFKIGSSLMLSIRMISS